MAHADPKAPAKITLSGGRRAGQVFAFCKAMGWNLKVYQRVTMLLMLFRSEYRPFIPPRPVRPFSFHDHWMETKKDRGHGWTTVIIDEFAFSPRP